MTKLQIVKTCVDCGTTIGTSNSTRKDNGPWRRDKKTGDYPLCNSCWYERDPEPKRAAVQKLRDEKGKEMLIVRQTKRKYNIDGENDRAKASSVKSYWNNVDKRREQKREYNGRPEVRARDIPKKRARNKLPEVKVQHKLQQRQSRIIYRVLWFELLCCVQ